MPATYTSIANGAWMNPAVWSPAGPPGDTDHAIIQDYRIDVTPAGVPVAGSLEIKSGMLYLTSIPLTITRDVRFGPDAQMNYQAPLTGEVLAVGGDCYINCSRYSLKFGRLTVAGRLRGCRVWVGSSVITLVNPGMFVGGALYAINASGGNRIVAHGCINRGFNTNVDFYLARNRRPVSMLSRRAFWTGMAA